MFPSTAPRQAATVGAISVGYLLVSTLLIGFKPEQSFLVVLCDTLYFLTLGTRKFLLAFSVFLVFWILFDYMKAFPNYSFAPVHTHGLYELERGWYTIHRSTFKDVLAGCFYLCWMPVPLGFGVWLLYRRGPEAYLRFSLTFLLVNLIGFVGYYAYPAAPPWYIRDHGFTVVKGTTESTAGLQAFDDFFHVGIFRALYTQGSNIFAAMPSLHAAYPLTVLYHAVRNKARGGIVLGAVVSVGIWWAAVYTGHHFVLDVIAGIACGCLGFLVFDGVLMRLAWFRRFLDGFSRLLSK